MRCTALEANWQRIAQTKILVKASVSRPSSQKFFAWRTLCQTWTPEPLEMRGGHQQDRKPLNQ